MGLFKKIETKNIKSLKKFAKVFYVIWCAISLVMLGGGIAFSVMFIKSKVTLFLILMIICFLSAILFFSTALLQSVTLYAMVNFITAPQIEKENEKEFKKQVAELVKTKEMRSLSLINDEEYEAQKRNIFEKIYSYFDTLNKKEIVSKFLYLYKCGAVDDAQAEKENYFNETRYKKALVLMRGGDYEEAKEIFEELGDYKSSRKMAENLKEKLTKTS